MSKFSGRSLAGFSLLMVTLYFASMTSCIAPKKLIYFHDLPDTIDANKPVTITATKYTEPIIIPNDILAITVQTIAQNEGNAPISSNTVAMFNPLNGFLVDKNGFVELSLIGFVKLGGLTTTEARELIKQKAREYYKEPVVNCRIANFDVSLIGDVNAPGTYSYPAEKVSILDAIVSGRDLQLTGKRKNVLLIRTEGEQKKFVRFDLGSTEIFSSPYFYLRQRDIVYVEPNKYKIQSSDQTFLRNVGLFSSVLAVLSLALAFRSK